MQHRTAEARAQYFERLPIGIWAVDADDRTVDVNPALVEALGYPVEELLGRSPAEFLVPESRPVYEAQSILRRSGLADSFTVTMRTRSGDTRAFRVSGSPLYEGDRYVGKVAVLCDLASWSLVEGAMRELRAEVLAGPRPGGGEARELSHDLRNPMQAILGFAELLRAGTPGPLNAEQVRQLGMIEAAAREALAHLEAFDRGSAAPPASAPTPPGPVAPPVDRRR